LSERRCPYHPHAEILHDPDDRCSTCGMALPDETPTVPMRALPELPHVIPWSKTVAIPLSMVPEICPTCGGECRLVHDIGNGIVVQSCPRCQGDGTIKP
jgi:hypothetical protein